MPACWDAAYGLSVHCEVTEPEAFGAFTSEVMLKKKSLHLLVRLAMTSLPSFCIPADMLSTPSGKHSLRFLLSEILAFVLWKRSSEARVLFQIICSLA